MSEEVTINKRNPLSPPEDYEAMRAKGLKLIEQLGHGLWTDYNNSDPGITILEALVYAITDLGYRTGFDVKDLLAPENLTEDTWKEIFYTARNILPNNALTLSDYRKLIIDTEGVRNAWIEPSKEYEVPVWVDYNFYKSREEEDCACEHPELISCLGKLGLQASTQDQFSKFKVQKLADIKQQLDEAAKEMDQLNTEIEKIKKELETETDPVAIAALHNSLEPLQNQLAWKNSRNEELAKENELVSGMTFHDSKIVEFEGLYNVMVEYEENIIDENQREVVRQKVVQKLLANRNLCEDFLAINAVEYENFGIGASVSLEENADPDVVLAKMFFTIYKYFTPSVPFWTIPQMMEKGYSIDEIFEGPALQYGFIEDAELEKTNLFRDIRLSDIINEIMDIEGIKAITYLHLPFISFDDSGDIYFNEWITKLQNEKKIARIQPDKSQVIFCKERELITYYTGSDKDRRVNRMLKLFSDFKAEERRYRLQNVSLDLPVPEGEYMNLEDYYTVTDTLPMTYGVSERAGLPANADEKRKVQALQLKGYLLFFEQILHDYLLHLNHLKDIYTMDNSAEHTYFTSALTQLNDLQSLLIDVENRGNDEAAIRNDFSDFLKSLIEPPEQFLKRRNVFLNHFLARFSEDLSDYEAISRLLNYGNVEQELVLDKTNILKFDEYKKISGERGRGYNYADPDFWDTESISGSERRISRLLGFSGVNRRYLAPEFIVIDPVMVTDKKKQSVQKTDVQGNLLNVVTIRNPDNNEDVLLTSVEVKDGCCTEQLVQDILANADIAGHLKIQDNLKRRARKTAGAVGDFWFELYDGEDPLTAVLLGSSPHYDKVEKRDQVLKMLNDSMIVINNNEGLHLVENVLLRPRIDEVFDENNDEVQVSFLNICLQSCDLGIGINEGEIPKFKKKISRVPAEKCYDKMPWILEYLEVKDNPEVNADGTSEKKEQSVLFQKVTVKDDYTTIQNLKFRRYADLSQRISDLVEFGSEVSNYSIVSNDADVPADIRYCFLIYNDKGETLAQSLFAYNKRTKQQMKDGTKIENDIQEIITDLAEWFGNEMDWYCEPNPCDNNEDPYSFRTTIVLPCWPKRFRDHTFKNLVEKTINAETPAHVMTRIVWLGFSEMKRFEAAYYNWLEEISITEIPAYEKVNPLVDVLNTLRPCGVCEDDCGHAPTETESTDIGKENPS